MREVAAVEEEEMLIILNTWRRLREQRVSPQQAALLGLLVKFAGQRLKQEVLRRYRKSDMGVGRGMLKEGQASPRYGENKHLQPCVVLDRQSRLVPVWIEDSLDLIFPPGHPLLATGAKHSGRRSRLHQLLRKARSIEAPGAHTKAPDEEVRKKMTSLQRGAATAERAAFEHRKLGVSHSGRS